MQKEAVKRGILVVDEDSTFARRLVEFLQSHGFAASAFSSHKDALAAACTEHPDLALVDVDLPEDSGLTLGETLRSAYDVQFVILSRMDDAETARRAREVGALAYLVKTAQLQHYLTIVHAAMSRTDELRVLRQREAQLNQTLQQTRAISMATHVLMERARSSRDEAFDRLRGLSRAQRRPLIEVAEELLTSTEALDAIAPLPPSDELLNS